jgi:hypothetical protein
MLPQSLIDAFLAPPSSFVSSPGPPWRPGQPDVTGARPERVSDHVLSVFVKVVGIQTRSSIPNPNEPPEELNN